MDEKERLKKHLEYLCSFDKLTGEPEALLAVNYLIQTLKEDGISCHTEKFDAYLSNPIHSHLVIKAVYGNGYMIVCGEGDTST